MSESSKSCGMKCGECIYFKSVARVKNCCSKEGVRAFAKAPAHCFVPDITQVTTSPEQLASFFSLCNTLTPKQLRIIIAILVQASIASAKQLSIGSKVYVLSGEDYISNYLAAYVFQYMPDNTVVISGSPRLNCRGKSFIGYVSQSSIIAAADWPKKRASLIKQGRIIDPEKSTTALTSSVDSFEPDVPTIDTVPEDWLHKTEPDSKKKFKDAYDRLTQFLA